MIAGLQKIPLSFLVRFGWLETEMRVQINRDKVSQYAEEMRQGDKFPPPVVFIDSQGRYWVGDGFHRIGGHEENGDTDIEVDLRSGTKLDAILYNIRENNIRQRGLPFGRGDKRKAVETLLREPSCADWSRSRIAEATGTTASYVCEIVRINNGEEVLPARAWRLEEIERLVNSGLGTRDISKKLGIAQGSVRVQRARLRRRRLIAVAKQEIIKCPHCNGSGYIPANQLADGKDG